MEALAALSGVELIIHAGDIGSPEVLDRLRAIAPVIAVRGNIDKGAWAVELPQTEVLDVGGVTLYVIHDLSQLDLDPAVAELDAVIAGHSHRAKLETRNGVLYLNPGSAGPRRFSLPLSLARLEIADAKVTARIVELHPGGVA